MPLLAFSAHSERTRRERCCQQEPKPRRLPRRNHPNLWWVTFREERRRVDGLSRTQEVSRFKGDLIHIFDGLDDGSAVACLSAFGNASVGRTRTARNPSPAPSGEAPGLR